MTLPQPKGILVDIDGTLLTADGPVPGAALALDALRARGIGIHLLSNLTLRTPDMLAAELAAYGFTVPSRHILTAPLACRRFLDAQPSARCLLLIGEGTRPLFESVEEDREQPDFVVVGDPGDGLTPALLNLAFERLMQGARLLALNRNPHWTPPGGSRRLDTGAFVALLEYASGQEARVFGKPSPDFFLGALASLGIAPAEALVVGDDPRTDLAGAAALGIPCILVGTGRFPAGSPVPAGAGYCPSIAGLPDLLASAGTRAAA